MARPLRFRVSRQQWDDARVRRDLLASLDEAIGAERVAPRFEIPGDYRTDRFEMDNGDVALFARSAGDDPAYWMGNTETPETLWRTDKIGWTEAPYAVERWAQRELLADLVEAEPWLADYDHLAWFFLPVLMSKDGRSTTRRFFREEAAGFPGADRTSALSFYEEFLSTGALDDHREAMAGKLGTSESFDRTRMRSAMAEFTVARLLHGAGFDLDPDPGLPSGHALDFRASRDGRSVLVEVTRPQPPARRSAGSPSAAVRETVAGKLSGQLDGAGERAVLFVDCSSFPDDDWRAVRGESPAVRHRPAVVFRARPTGRIEGYRLGDPPDLRGAVEWMGD